MRSVLGKLALVALLVAGAQSVVAPSHAAAGGVVERVWDVPGSPYRPGEPVVALTFDDGPNPRFTAQILDVLRRFAVPGTFFQIGASAAAYPDLTRAVAAEGHAVANHTWSHRDLRSVPESQYGHQIGDTGRLLQSLTGQDIVCTRPPGGAVNGAVVARLAARRQATVMWSADSQDWRRPGVAAIVRNAVAGVGPGSIILLHDGGGDRSQTVAAPPQIIQTIRARGLTLVPVCGDRSHRPFGSLDAVDDLGGGVRVGGWALDPDSAESLQVHVYVDGSAAGADVAGDPRPDVAAAFSTGPNHGFDVAVPTTPGRHRVCVYAINVGVGFGNPELGCRDVQVTPSAIGNVDSAGWVPGAGIRVRGWTADPDAPGESTSVHVTVNGKTFDAGTATLTRPDLAAAYPWAGPHHGFEVTVPAPDETGHVAVCAYVINLGRGVSNPNIGCRVIPVRHEPIGHLDEVSWVPGRGVRVVGWAADPDVGTEAVRIHVYLGGTAWDLGPATLRRSDVTQAHSWAGPDHGFDAIIPVGGAGEVEVCAYAINVGLGGSEPSIGCRRAALS